jgi:manganese/iron transport system substrate-binding protein
MPIFKLMNNLNLSKKSFSILTTFLMLIVFGTSACAATSPSQLTSQSDTDQQVFKVVATTTIVADIVDEVGGDEIELVTLLPVGADPHTFDPTPQDIAAVADAQVVFANGAGLEEFLEPLIESAGAASKVVYVSDGIEYLQLNGASESETQNSLQNSTDPHTWTDPNNIIIWVKNIKNTLSGLDPANEELYNKNAASYITELKDLDTWIREQVSQIPPENRLIVTDHLQYAYFAKAYGFTQLGAIIPGFSTTVEASAQELASLTDVINQDNVKAIFVGKTANPNLAERIAEDTGTQVIFLYTGSLTEAGGEADNYLDYVRFNVDAIVEALE